MRILSSLSLAFTIAVTLTLAALPSAHAQVFPSFTSEDLNGTEHTLPEAFPGDPTIVFIAYKRGQQEDVNTWINALNLDANIGPEFVELPVVGTLVTPMKSYINNGMRKGIVDTAMRGRTITLYENASKVNEPLGFTGRDDIRTLLVRPNGNVLWSTSGPASPDQVADLKRVYTESLQ